MSNANKTVENICKTEKNIETVERSDTWNEQDRLDIAVFSLQYVADLYSNEEKVV